MVPDASSRVRPGLESGGSLGGSSLSRNVGLLDPGSAAGSSLHMIMLNLCHSLARRAVVPRCSRTWARRFIRSLTCFVRVPNKSQGLRARGVIHLLPPPRDHPIDRMQLPGLLVFYQPRFTAVYVCASHSHVTYLSILRGSQQNRLLCRIDPRDDDNDDFRSIMAST